MRATSALVNPDGTPVDAAFTFELRHSTLLAAAEAYGIPHHGPPASSLRIRHAPRAGEPNRWTCVHGDGQSVPAAAAYPPHIDWCPDCRPAFEGAPGDRLEQLIGPLVDVCQGLEMVGLCRTPSAALAARRAGEHLADLVGLGYYEDLRLHRLAKSLLRQVRRHTRLSRKPDPAVVAAFAALPAVDGDPFPEVAERWWVAAMSGGTVDSVHAHTSWAESWSSSAPGTGLHLDSLRHTARRLAADGGPLHAVEMREAHTNGCAFPGLSICQWELTANTWSPIPDPGPVAVAAAPAEVLERLVANKALHTCTRIEDLGPCGDPAQARLAAELARDAAPSDLATGRGAWEAAQLLLELPAPLFERAREAAVALSEGWSLNAAELVEAAVAVEGRCSGG